jgi:predicted lipid-binding transport protein (Tim44 family)
MGRIIGTTLGVILAIWIAVTAADGILATLKTFLIIGLIALAVFIVVWFLAGRPRRSSRGAAGRGQAADERRTSPGASGLRRFRPAGRGRWRGP